MNSALNPWPFVAALGSNSRVGRLAVAACLVLCGVLIATAAAEVAAPPDDGKLRIICFGAHPDDCELRAGGVAAMWAAKGHHVLFVSVTNGDIGHWREAGAPLARRRKAEVERAHRILGIRGEILDIHAFRATTPCISRKP